MSFRCDLCKRQVAHGAPQTKIVVKEIPIKHPFREKANRDGSNDPGGIGTRIVKEMKVGDCCVASSNFTNFITCW